MAKGDIMPFESAGPAKMTGSLKYAVNSGTTASINAGEPVQKAAGAAYVALAATNFPTTTLRVVGVAASASTETASATGTVDVVPATNGQLWLIAPKVAATWNTQAKYNALVGSRVLIDLTTAVFTILATDGASNGCIVEYLDIARYPGMVAFSWSPLCDYRNV
jgi:hypothetical protein